MTTRQHGANDVVDAVVIGTGAGGKNAGRATIWSSGANQSFGFQGGDRAALAYGARSAPTSSPLSSTAT